MESTLHNMLACTNRCYCITTYLHGSLISTYVCGGNQYACKVKEYVKSGKHSQVSIITMVTNQRAFGPAMESVGYYPSSNQLA